MPRLSQAKRLEMQKKFSEVDKSGDRKLDVKEMSALLKQGNPNLADDDIKKLYRRIDKNNDGSVDFDEFVAYLYNQPKPIYNASPAVIQKFEEFAGREMDGTEFSKFCVDCGLLDRGFRKEDIATTFAKVLPRGKRKITTEQSPSLGYSQYDKLLTLLAEKKKVTFEQIEEMVLGGEKTCSGTKADNVRFHDDKSLYTGAHAANENHGDCTTHEREREKYDIGQDADWGGCKSTFEKFCAKGDVLLNRDFTKLVDDSGLCDRRFTNGDADVVFAQVMGHAKKMDFEAFQEALRKVAERKQEPISDLQAIVSRCSGPEIHATQAEAVRFHDDKEMYTGTHAGK